MNTPHTRNSELRTQDSIPPPSPSVAKLAAKVAHELNNPLDAVLRLVSLAQRKNQSGNHTDVERHLADAQTGLQRMAEILRELMDIGRQTHETLTQPPRAPLDEILTQSLRTVAAIAEQKQVRIEIAPNAPLAKQPLPRYDLRLAQILSNLLKNAVEASPENATVQIAFHLQPSPGPKQESLFSSDHWPAPDHLTLTIQDAGPGIDPALLPRLFTPFLTTKPRGKGHGLGLAISRDLTASLGGTLTLQNTGRQPGAEPNSAQGGCLATIRLPVEQSRS